MYKQYEQVERPKKHNRKDAQKKLKHNSHSECEDQRKVIPDGRYFIGKQAHKISYRTGRYKSPTQQKLAVAQLMKKDSLKYILQTKDKADEAARSILAAITKKGTTLSYIDERERQSVYEQLEELKLDSDVRVQNNAKLIKNKSLIGGLINDGETEKEARTNCAIATVAALAGLGKTSEVTGPEKQGDQFFISYLNEKCGPLTTNDDMQQNLQNLGMIKWLYEKKSKWPQGWNKEKFQKNLTKVNNNNDTGDFTKEMSINESETYMKQFKIGTRFALGCKCNGIGITPHWLVAQKTADEKIIYIDYQSNRRELRDNLSVDKDSSYSQSLRSSFSKQKFSDDSDDEVPATKEIKKSQNGLKRGEPYIKIKHKDMRKVMIYDVPICFSDRPKEKLLEGFKADTITAVIPQA